MTNQLGLVFTSFPSQWFIRLFHNLFACLSENLNWNEPFEEQCFFNSDAVAVSELCIALFLLFYFLNSFFVLLLSMPCASLSLRSLLTSLWADDGRVGSSEIQA